MLELRYKTILAVALPMMISGFIQSLVLITDAAFISRYSTEAFDAVGNGGLIYITMYMCLLGMGDGAQIIIARRIGEERPEAIGRIFGSSVLMNCLLAAVLFIILYFIMPGSSVTLLAFTSERDAVVGSRGSVRRAASEKLAV